MFPVVAGDGRGDEVYPSVSESIRLPGGEWWVHDSP